MATMHNFSMMNGGMGMMQAQNIPLIQPDIPMQMQQQTIPMMQPDITMQANIPIQPALPPSIIPTPVTAPSTTAPDVPMASINVEPAKKMKEDGVKWPYPMTT